MTTANYPLSWPLGWPRTKPDDRKPGQFTKRAKQQYSHSNDSYNVQAPLSIAQGIARVLDELERFTLPRKRWRIVPDDVIISTNLKVRRADGLPRSDQREPDDPGVAVYFDLDGNPRVVPCDRYTTVAQNLGGIAATLSALRALERHGSGIMERAFTGFEALPHLANTPWWVILEVDEDASYHEVRRNWMRLRSAHHPDNDGDASRFSDVNKAWTEYEEANL